MSATRRGPKRSATMPPGAPSRNQRNAATEKTSAIWPREAPNSPSKALKKAANEYAAVKPTNIRVKAAPTTTQPYLPVVKCASTLLLFWRDGGNDLDLAAAPVAPGSSRPPA